MLYYLLKDKIFVLYIIVNYSRESKIKDEHLSLSSMDVIKGD
jgi:hypothetical protein